MFILVTGIAFVLLLLYVIYKPPSFVISQMQHRWPDVLFSVKTTRKVVALTIDDAPSAYTPEIAKLLKQNGAHATFFVIGSQVARNEKVLSDLVIAGHELGNHAMHDEPSRSLPEGTLVDQIHELENMIMHIYHSADPAKDPPRYFRPGSGFFSDGMRAMAQRLGYKLILGSIYPHDPQIRAWRINAAHILSKIEPGGIIICHDRREWTVPMLKTVLPQIKEMGYEIVTITELLKEMAHNEQSHISRE